MTTPLEGGESAKVEIACKISVGDIVSLKNKAVGRREAMNEPGSPTTQTRASSNAIAERVPAVEKDVGYKTQLEGPGLKAIRDLMR